MSQHDLEIANQGFAAFRQDLNDALQALGGLQSGADAPATTYANMFWYETDTDKLYIRNEDNDAWIEVLTFDQANDHLATIGATITLDGAGNMSLAGDLTVDTDTLYVDSTNNKVGIGTTSVDSDCDRLQVASSSANTVKINGTGTRDLYSYHDSGGCGWATGSDSSWTNLIYLQESANAIEFYTNGSKRATIDNIGNILLGKTSTAVDPIGCMLKANGQIFATTNGSDSFHNYDTSQNRYEFYVKSNGGIANYSSNNVNLSDETEKKNITAAASAWDDVKGLSLKEFHYTFEDDADPKQLGVIAQDVQVNHPDLIKSFKIDDDTDKLGVVEQQITWMAIKALQEAIAKIETLETKVAALEAV